MIHKSDEVYDEKSDERAKKVEIEESMNLVNTASEFIVGYWRIQHQ
jgi:hypothetical protein